MDEVALRPHGRSPRKAARSTRRERWAIVIGIPQPLTIDCVRITREETENARGVAQTRPGNVRCGRWLGSTALELCNLLFEPLPILIDPLWKLATDFVKLVDHMGEALFPLQIACSQDLRNIPIVFLSKRVQVPQLDSARGTLLWKGVNPKAEILVPMPLFACSETELRIAATAPEDGIKIPISRTNATVLP